jgi:hypothetical protein
MKQELPINGETKAKMDSKKEMTAKITERMKAAAELKSQTPKRGMRMAEMRTSTDRRMNESLSCRRGYGAAGLAPRK